MYDTVSDLLLCDTALNLFIVFARETVELIVAFKTMGREQKRQ